MQSDTGLETLLDLDGYIIAQDLACWVKVEAWRVVAIPKILHGIRYSLTLHEPYGKPIMGYDNSHAIKPPKKFKYPGQRLAYDQKHRHIADKGVPYEFKDACQLLADLFEEVDRVSKEMEL